MSKWVEHFPHANPDLLLKAETLFVSKLTIHQQLEAVILFASALDELQPKDVDFFIVSNDPLLKHVADRWISMIQHDYWHKEFTPDFFFRISTSLDPTTIDGKRDFDKEIYKTILAGRKCVIFTRNDFVDKYLDTFPNSFVVHTKS